MKVLKLIFFLTLGVLSLSSINTYALSRPAAAQAEIEDLGARISSVSVRKVFEANLARENSILASFSSEVDSSVDKGLAIAEKFISALRNKDTEAAQEMLSANKFYNVSKNDIAKKIGYLSRYDDVYLFLSHCELRQSLSSLKIPAEEGVEFLLLTYASQSPVVILPPVYIIVKIGEENSVLSFSYAKPDVFDKKETLETPKVEAKKPVKTILKKEKVYPDLERTSLQKKLIAEKILQLPDSKRASFESSSNIELGVFNKINTNAEDKNKFILATNKSTDFVEYLMENKSSNAKAMLYRGGGFDYRDNESFLTAQLSALARYESKFCFLQSIEKLSKAPIENFGEGECFTARYKLYYATSKTSTVFSYRYFYMIFALDTEKERISILKLSSSSSSRISSGSSTSGIGSVAKFKDNYVSASLGEDYVKVGALDATSNIEKLLLSKNNIYEVEFQNIINEANIYVSKFFRVVMQKNTANLKLALIDKDIEGYGEYLDSWILDILNEGAISSTQKFSLKEYEVRNNISTGFERGIYLVLTYTFSGSKERKVVLKVISASKTNYKFIIIAYPTDTKFPPSAKSIDVSSLGGEYKLSLKNAKEGELLRLIKEIKDPYSLVEKANASALDFLNSLPNDKRENIIRKMLYSENIFLGYNDSNLKYKEKVVSSSTSSTSSSSSSSYSLSSSSTDYGYYFDSFYFMSNKLTSTTLEEAKIFNSYLAYPHGEYVSLSYSLEYEKEKAEKSKVLVSFVVKIGVAPKIMFVKFKKLQD